VFKVSLGKIKAYIQLFEGILKSQRDRSFNPCSINPDLLEMIRCSSIFIPLGQVLSCKSIIGYKSTELKCGNQNLANFFIFNISWAQPSKPICETFTKGQGNKKILSLEGG